LIKKLDYTDRNYSNRQCPYAETGPWKCPCNIFYDNLLTSGGCAKFGKEIYSTN